MNYECHELIHRTPMISSLQIMMDMRLLGTFEKPKVTQEKGYKRKNRIRRKNQNIT